MSKLCDESGHDLPDCWLNPLNLDNKLHLSEDTVSGLTKGSEQLQQVASSAWAPQQEQGKAREGIPEGIRTERNGTAERMPKYRADAPRQWYYRPYDWQIGSCAVSDHL